MNCPVCKEKLKMSERQGIEIDYCPQCRGVWLDRGELDKIIERSTSGSFEREHEDQSFKIRKHKNDYHHGKKKKRKSFLEDMFDFG